MNALRVTLAVLVWLFVKGDCFCLERTKTEIDELSKRAFKTMPIEQLLVFGYGDGVWSSGNPLALIELASRPEVAAQMMSALEQKNIKEDQQLGLYLRALGEAIPLNDIQQARVVSLIHESWKRLPVEAESASSFEVDNIYVSNGCSYLAARPTTDGEALLLDIVSHCEPPWGRIFGKFGSVEFGLISKKPTPQRLASLEALESRWRTTAPQYVNGDAYKSLARAVEQMRETIGKVDNSRPPEMRPEVSTRAGEELPHVVSTPIASTPLPAPSPNDRAREARLAERAAIVGAIGVPVILLLIAALRRRSKLRS